MNNRFLSYQIILFALVTLGACKGSIKQAFKSTSPYEQYLNALEKAELHQSPMGRAWIEAGQRVFKDSIPLSLPFSESGYFSAAEPGARAVAFSVKEGQVVSIVCSSQMPANGRLFMDLFIWQDNKWERVQETLVRADTSAQLTHEFSSDSRGLLRLQPELLSKAFYTLSVALRPVLANPVSGGTNRSIGSLYGVDRDGGRRSHEGVDIFAPKGTPVIAPADGLISRVGNNNLGGKVIFMQDLQRRQSYYFAHLDSQLVSTGRRVKQGDTLGLVGNTGNARNTPPHLHFDIYQQGSKDPIHYLRVLESPKPSPQPDTLVLLHPHVTTNTTIVKSGPADEYLIKTKIPKGTYMEIVAQSGGWYRVQLPDKQEGFVQRKLVQPATKGSSFKISPPIVLLSEPAAQAVPIAQLGNTENAVELAKWENFSYIRTGDGTLGWVER